MSLDNNFIINERTVELTDSTISEELRKLWREEKLLAQSKDPLNSLRPGSKRFYDTMMSHTARMQVFQDEISIEEQISDFMESQFIGREREREREVGEGGERERKGSWNDYIFNSSQPTNVTLSNLKYVASWFRSMFPYYYDECAVCGNKHSNEFIGYVYPSKAEREHSAGRTELYYCGCPHCRSDFRFPRYNSMKQVLSTRKGRCGEYSVLMLHILRFLGYKVRWVVDWADHCFDEVEVLIDDDFMNERQREKGEREREREKGSVWVHLDPCEAAVDEPLIYQSWGKNQTYLIAFTDDDVIDVTDRYTSDFEAAKQRREVTIEEVEVALQDARRTLRERGRERNIPLK
eukprot:CAMPEP_0182423452 /NCGR_PEP_ID=MMETSP1167-20130531/9468_1 /TAXON_ID=2988 /ORGANISM="Mallomonas Sp, Strain CCMP3275" /LENGTH=348 /DNA_ID=CAMNT_0024602459 /DNA_START=437 /DNA_END=1483 /DNA_ORIENTATION=+